MIYIVGAGWYGCHIASELLKAGYEITMVDKANAFFTGSSARNQNRLHLGYHYPRSFATIVECRRGFEAFKSTYPTLSTAVPNNLYLIGSASKTTAAQFSEQFGLLGEDLSLDVRGVEPWQFRVNEEYIDNATAAEYFRNLLSLHFRQLPPDSFSSLERLRDVLEIKDDDWIVNCTYNQLSPITMDSYELYCSLVYHIPGELFALTVMDGDYFSIYPYDLERKLYTVTSVRNGVVWRGDRIVPLAVDVEGVKTRVEAEVVSVYPAFPTRASYHSHFLSWKTKPVTDEEDRSLRFQAEGRVLSLYGGKITGIFDAAERVLFVVRCSEFQECPTIEPM